MSNRLKVNPRRVDGKDLKVLDLNNRVIANKPGGNNVPSNSFYRRLVNAGDLVELAKPPKTRAQKEKPKPKTPKSGE